MDAGDAIGSLDVEAVGCDQELVVGDDPHEAVEEAVAQLGQPGLEQELSEVARGHRVAEQQEREESREAIGRGREPPPVHLEIGVRKDRLAGRVQAPGNPGTGEPGGGELLPQPRRAVRRGRGGRRLQILTFFNVSQPAWTGASSEPSAFWGA